MHRILSIAGGLLLVLLSSCVSPPRFMTRTGPKRAESPAVLEITGTDPLRLHAPDKGRFLAGRRKDARRKALSVHPKADAIQAAISGGLTWLAAQQKPTGEWSSPDPVATTSLALLAFLANGEVPGSPLWGRTVEGAAGYLLDQQQQNGGFGKTGDPDGPYRHALSLIAISELHALTGEKNLLQPILRGADLILRQQLPRGGWAPGYRVPARRRNTPIGSLQLQALTLSRWAQPTNTVIAGAIKEGLADLAAVQDGKSGKFGLETRGLGSVVYSGGACFAFQMNGLGHALSCRKGLVAMEEALSEWPGTPRNALVPMSFLLAATHQGGGRMGDRYYDKLVTILLNRQEENGRWYSPAGESNRSAAYATAACLLMLQTPYRYGRVVDDGVPSLWRAERAGEVAYLFSQAPMQAWDLHLIGSSIDRALEESEALFFETRSTRLRQVLVRQAATGDTTPDSPQVAETKRRLAGAFGSRLVPAGRLQKYPPWALALALLGQETNQAGWADGGPLEPFLRVRAAGKPWRDLVPPEHQARWVAELNASNQVAVAEAAIALADEWGSLLKAYNKAWAGSTWTTVAARQEQLLSAHPGVARLIAEQNAHVTRQIAKETAAQGSCFIVLPAYRLVGKDGVIGGLRSRGYRVAPFPSNDL